MERARQEAYIRSFAARPEVRRMEQFVQHGNTSCLLHCVAVAHVSFAIARALHLRVREEALSRGALLHDYFLYDWHVRDPLRKKHAFFHPSAALENARRVFELSEVERDIIRKHMFPLTPVPPRYREGWLVVLADKVCSVYEFFRKDAYRGIKIRYFSH